jgi:peptidoglycan hydrolase-like protein with peptidoglycan-binding domain
VKKLIIAIIAAVSLPAIATLSATAQLGQSNELNMDAIPNLNQDNVRQVQQALQKKGVDPGPVDGVLGPRTKGAVRNFQDRYGMKASGEIDNQTLYALGEAELAGQGGSEPDRSR